MLNMIMQDDIEIQRPKFPEGVSLWWNLPRKDMTPEQLEIKRKYDKESKTFYRNNPEYKQKDLESQRRYTEKNRKKVYERNQEWRKNNWDAVYKQRKESGSQRRNINKWYHSRGKHNINHVLSERLRIRIRRALHGKCKSKSTIELLGCDVDFFKLHLQNQFQENMSWDNYGEWHIDHIIPCCSFDLSIPEEQFKCFNYVNLRPLWGIENLLKSKEDKKISINNKNLQ
jgi:hypothetical protein